MSLGLTTAADLASEMMAARDERRLLRFQKQIAAYQLLIIDEPGFVPLSKTGAELLLESRSQRYERGATLIASKIPFDEWTETLGSERLTGAMLVRIIPTSTSLRRTATAIVSPKAAPERLAETLSTFPLSTYWSCLEAIA
eukprot:gene7586-biopygen6436